MNSGPVEPPAGNARVIAQTPSLIDAHTRVRDRDASRSDVLLHGRRIIRLLLEEAVGLLPRDHVQVITPAGHRYAGCRAALDRLSAVAVVRAGEAMEPDLGSIAPDVRIGKILVQRDRATKRPSMHWAHLPSGIKEGHVLLLEPMLATGGSLLTALRVLEDAGVRDDRVIVVSVLASPQGLDRLAEARPAVRVVTSSIEQRLDDDGYMVPGIGDFGDRWFGTEGDVAWS